MPGIAGQPHFAHFAQLHVGWMTEASCAEHPDIDWFDTDCGLMAAAQICYSCPVKTHCLDHAVAIRAEDGIWAGLWGDQLQAMIAKRILSKHG